MKPSRLVTSTNLCCCAFSWRWNSPGGAVAIPHFPASLTRHMKNKPRCSTQSTQQFVLGLKHFPETSSQFLTLSKLDQDQSVCSLVRRQSLLFIYCHVLVHVDDTLSIMPRPQSLHFLTSEMWGRLPCSAHLTECVHRSSLCHFSTSRILKLEVNTQFLISFLLQI